MLTMKALNKIKKQYKTVKNNAKYPTDLIIDLTGPHGNIYFLAGLCQFLPQQLRLSEEETKLFNAELNGVNYSTRLKIMQKWFGISFVHPADI